MTDVLEHGSSHEVMLKVKYDRWQSRLFSEQRTVSLRW